jgi:hypothetical protein
MGAGMDKAAVQMETMICVVIFIWNANTLASSKKHLLQAGLNFALGSLLLVTVLINAVRIHSEYKDIEKWDQERHFSSEI